jgi:thiazole tautomerase (transcriptional regulator TenI)
MAVRDACRVVIHASDRPGASCAALLVGASVHSLEEGVAARIEGASWGVVSNVLRGVSDSDVAHHDPGANPGPTGGIALARQLAGSSGIPIVAIGGITPHHVAPLRRIGVHGVAAIRGIWDHENAEGAASEYLSAYDSPVGR